MALILSSFWLWGRCEDVWSATLAKKYRPLPLPKDPHYLPSDVSIVVATIDTPETFPQCLRQWIDNNPKEIVVVTIERDLQLVQNLVAQVPEAEGKIQVLTAAVANKRDQLAVGIRVAKGSIIGLVDDDAFWPKTTVLPYLLAGLEDPQVGATQGLQSAYMPEENCHPDKITPWEVAAIRQIEGQNNVQAIRYAADGGCFCLVGRTILMRSQILKDEAFLKAMCNEVWAGNRLNTGDDCFISRWMMIKGWKFHIQNAPEAEILTLVPNDINLIWQLVRWKRSSLQQCLLILFDKPGLSRYYQTYPYCARKLVERLLGVAITWLHLYAWLSAFRNTPAFALTMLSWYIFSLFTGYRAFVKKFPYCGKKIWAAFLADQSGLILDPFGWATINKEGWLTRKDQE